MAYNNRISRTLVIAIGAALFLLISTMASAQVVQERSHAIEQTGSGAPAVSVTSDDRAVSSTRNVRLDDGTADATTRVYTSPDATRYEDRRQPADTQTYNSRTDHLDTDPGIEPLNAPGIQPLRDYQRDESAQYTESDIRNLCAQNPSPQYLRDRGLSPDVCDRYNTVADGDASVRDYGRIGPISISQTGQANGEDASLVQQIIISINSMMGQETIESRTSARGTDLASQQEAEALLDQGGADTVLRSQASSGGTGSVATEQHMDSRTDDARVTLQTREASQGQGAAVDNRIAVQQQGDRIRVSDDGVDRRTRTTDRGCFTHSHSHGWETHHGRYHIGTHAHSHTHCR